MEKEQQYRSLLTHCIETHIKSQGWTATLQIAAAFLPTKNAPASPELDSSIERIQAAGEAASLSCENWSNWKRSECSPHSDTKGPKLYRINWADLRDE